MKYNYEMLRKLIKKKHLTQNEFAKMIGIGRVSLSQRLNCKLYFTQEEINRAINVLGLSITDVPSYFFNEKV